MDTVPEFHAEAPQATVSEGLAQGPYVAARMGLEPTTLRTKRIESTKVPPRPTFLWLMVFFYLQNILVIPHIVPIPDINEPV